LLNPSLIIVRASSSYKHITPQLLRLSATAATLSHSFTLWLAIPSILHSPLIEAIIRANEIKVSLKSRQLILHGISGFLWIILK